MDKEPESLDELSELLAIQEQAEAFAIRMKEVRKSRDKLALIEAGLSLVDMSSNLADIIKKQYENYVDNGD